MKRTFSHLLSAIVFLGSLACLAAQTPLNWQVTARDSLSTTRQALDLVTNLTSGTVTTNLHQYVEVANAANYQDPATGAWTESQDLIELTPDGGAAAVRSGRKVFFSPNLNVSNAITLVSDQGRTFQTRPAAICYYDSASGQRIILATPQDSQAELSPPNVLEYAGAFGSLASMSYIATKSAFESDVLFTSRPQPPETYQLASQSTTIEIWHEWYDAPVPQINPHVIITNANPALDVSDEVLDFGDLWFPTGKAYFTDDQSPRETNVAAQIRIFNQAEDTNSIPVAKHWVQGTNGASSWLIESVNWTDIQPKLAGLPELSQADGAHGVTRPTQTAFTFPPPAPKASARSHALPVKLASAKAAAPSFTVDFTTISSSGSNYTFSSGTTYYIPVQGYFSGNVTFQNNCIIKYSNNADLLIYGSISCSGSSSSPSILTSMWDDSIGDNIQGGILNCPTAGASEALWSYYISTGQTVSGMKIRWASRGVQFDDNGCGTITNGIANSIIESCATGLYVNNCVLTNQNLTVASVSSACQTAGCGSVGSITSQTALADAIASGMETLTNGLTPSSAEYIWTNNMVFTNLQSNSLQYNTGSWVYGLKGLSSCSAGLVTYTTNGSTVYTNLNNSSAYIHNMTLITPQHALIAYHTASMFGQTYAFVGTNNTVYFGTVNGIYQVVTTNYYGTNTASGVGGNDIAIVEFKSTVNSNVQPASILSQTAIAKLPHLFWDPINKQPGECLATTLPCVACNQYKQACASDLYSFQLGYAQQPSMYFERSGSLWFPNWWISVPVNGDSGSPIYVLIQDELVLLGAWYAGAAPPNGPVAPWCGYDLNALNTAISNLCVSLGTTVYQVTAKDLSSFPGL